MDIVEVPEEEKLSQVPTTTDDDNGVSESDRRSYISHFQNSDAHSTLVRFGVPLWTTATLVVLINADVGSGVSADYILVKNDVILETSPLLVASVFSSVKELWNNGTYWLAVLIAVTSIAWPYVKLLLSFYAWFTPYQNPHQRERLVMILDGLGKWSFVDIIVLVEIMVAFRQSIVVAPGVSVEIVVRAQWGFYGFVVATMMSLLSTHLVLHFHRDLHYHTKKATQNCENSTQEQITENQADDPNDNESELLQSVKVSSLLASIVSLGLYVAGCIVDIYEVNNARGETSDVTAYSVIDVGQGIPESSYDDGDIGNRFIQIMWYFLCVAMPMWCSLLFGVIFLVPMSRMWMEKIFTMAEVAFAWSCPEVLLVSTLFSVLQMPTFGDGLIDSGCSQCFVDTSILPMVALFIVATLLNTFVNLWLYRKVHAVLYSQ